MDLVETEVFVRKRWEDSVIPTLSRFIEIPNQSPLFVSMCVDMCLLPREDMITTGS